MDKQERLRQQMESGLKPLEEIHERGKLTIWQMDAEEFAQYRKEVAEVMRGERR